MTAEFVRSYYRVPARLGMRITWQPDGEPPRGATIVGFQGARLRIRFDGDKHPVTAHPVYAITYPEMDAALARFRGEVVNLYLLPILDAQKALDATGAPPGPKAQEQP